MLYNICLLLIYFIHNSLYLLILYTEFVPPLFPLPFGNHQFVFYASETTSDLGEAAVRGGVKQDLNSQRKN